MCRFSVLLAVLFASIATAHPALAYIGPGAGLSAIGTAVAVIGAILLLIVGFVWYPVRRMLRNRRAKQEIPTDDSADSKS